LASGVDLDGVVTLSRSAVPRFSDDRLPIADRSHEAIAHVAVEFAEPAHHFLADSSLVHGNLRAAVYRGTSVSGGPASGRGVHPSPPRLVEVD
jgi:hypothetical protein